jgi:hypothetical protein
MCGRYRRKSDKQRIADAFEVTAGLDELDLGPDDNIAPGSIQPVVTTNQDGERQLELMRWGFKLPDRLLFNARSEGIETSKFWKDAFLKGRVIVPADAIFEWKEMPKGQKKPKYEFTLTEQELFGMAGVWKLWKNPKTDQWERTFAVITSTDSVHMPVRSRFVDAPHYYSTLFHELIHSTGHESRLNRTFGDRFGDDLYSKEELVAEMGAAFLCAIAEIANAHTDRNTTAYVQNWISKLEEDNRLIVHAAANAQKAVDSILGSTFAEEAEEDAANVTVLQPPVPVAAELAEVA